MNLKPSGGCTVEHQRAGQIDGCPESDKALHELSSPRIGEPLFIQHP